MRDADSSGQSAETARSTATVQVTENSFFFAHSKYTKVLKTVASNRHTKHETKQKQKNKYTYVFHVIHIIKHGSSPDRVA